MVEVILQFYLSSLGITLETHCGGPVQSECNEAGDRRFRQNETEEKEVLQEKHSIRVCPKVFTRKYLLRISSKLGLIMEFHSSQLRVPAVLMLILSCAN